MNRNITGRHRSIKSAREYIFIPKSAGLTHCEKSGAIMSRARLFGLQISLTEQLFMFARVINHALIVPIKMQGNYLKR